MFRLQTTKTSSLLAGRLAIITGTLLLAKLVCPAANPQAWVELRSPNFIVVTNSNEKQARLVADQFETIRAVFREYFQQSKASTDPSITIIAAKDEATFRDLLPEFWAKKGQRHPAALYRRGTNTNYVALRLDVLRPEVSLNAFASDAYRPIYEEYYAATMGQRTSQLPLWVAIGLTEVFGNTRVGSKDVSVGMPSTSNLTVL